MKISLKILLLLTIVAAIHCVGKSSGNLTIVVIPQSPILIPTGNSVEFGGKPIAPPFFTLNQVRITYTGTGVASINSLEVIQRDKGGGNYTCTIAGDDFVIIFSTAINSAGQVLIASGATIQTSGFACSGVHIPSPVPETFNIPMTVRITGTQLDSNSIPTGRVRGEAVITVQ